MKILNIGSKSIHVSSFLHRMQELDQYLFVEESCGYLSDEKEFFFKIRGLNFFAIIFNFWKMNTTLKKLNPEIIHIHQLNRFAFFVCLFAIVGAEYVLNLLPKGTHEYARLIKPSELADWVRAGGLELNQMKGMTYNPFTRVYAMNNDTDVNYLMATQKPLAN